MHARAKNTETNTLCPSGSARMDPQILTHILQDPWAIITSSEEHKHTCTDSLSSYRRNTLTPKAVDEKQVYNFLQWQKDEDDWQAL